MQKSLLAVALLGAAGLILGSATPVSPAFASDGTWSAPFNLSAAGSFAEGSISFDGAGNAIGAYREQDPATFSGSVRARSSSDCGATWGAVVDLSAPGHNADAVPNISFDGAQNGIVIWQDSASDTKVVQTRSASDGGASWNPVVTVSLDAPFKNPTGAKVGFDSAGNAIAIWKEASGDDVVQTRSSNDGGATWSPIFNLSAPGEDVRGPQISFDAAGNAIVIWDRDGVAQKRSTSDGGATWNPIFDLSAASIGDDAGPQISHDEAGNATAIWLAYPGDEIVQTRSSSDGGATWSAVSNLSEAGQNASELEIDSGASGNAIAVWSRSDGTNAIVQTRSTSDGGATWDSPVDLSVPAPYAFGANISFDDAGNAIASWTQYSDIDGIIQISTHAAPVVVDPGLSLDLSLDLAVGSPVAGSSVTAQASGLLAGTDWNLILRSTPITLDAGTVADSGSVASTVTIPAGLEPGWHTITLSGTSADGDAYERVLRFEIGADGNLASVPELGDIAAAVAEESELKAETLAATGQHPGIPLGVGLLALLAGLGAIVVNRSALGSALKRVAGK